jgi:Tol biopolymer transport system component
VGADLWLRDLTRGAEQRFTTDASLNLAPIWSPNGDRIVFNSNRGGGVYNLYQKATGGTGEEERLLTTENTKTPNQWSHGKFIVYSERDPTTKRDIWVLPMRGKAPSKPIPFLRSQFDEIFGQLSPDSRWMAYTSDKSGHREVYVRPFPGGEFQRQISIGGGEQPRWRADGKELFFVSADGRMMAVAVKMATVPKASLEPEVPQPLFEVHLAQTSTRFAFEYDVTADGKRFLLATNNNGSVSAPPLTAVVNWEAGLRK